MSCSFSEVRMNVYRTSPAKERKAAAELRRAYLPQEDGQTSTRRRFRRVVAPCYIFAEAKPLEATYVRECIGQIQRSDLTSLYSQRRSVKPPPPRPFQAGDSVTIKLGTGPMTGCIVAVQTANRVLVDVGSRILIVSSKRLELRDSCRTETAGN
jgi:hypothetical protein